MNKFDAHKRTVMEVFTYIYKIPFYQRGYSWKKEQVRQFWEDLMLVSEENQKEYFLGSIVLNEKENTFEVIDGQQRLTTITIFLCAIRDFLLKNQVNDNAMNIHQNYIAKRDVRGNDKYRLTLSEVNMKFFEQFIQTPINAEGRKTLEDYTIMPSSKKTASNTNLLDAYNNMMEYIDDFVKQNNDENYDALLTILEIVIYRFLMISISVTSDSDAYIIFETLNDRGMDLSTADLLKNHLFSRAYADDLRRIQEDWKNLTTSLNQINITTFLRHYWLAKHERVTDKRLYEKIKKHLEKAHVTVKSFVEDLANSADIYVNILNPSYDYWGNYSIVRSLENINSLNYKAAYSVIMIGKSKLNDVDLLKLIESCEKFLFKYTTIGGNSPSDVEKFFTILTKKLKEEGSEGIDGIFSLFQKKQPTDSQFMLDFSIKVISKQKVQRYILEKLNEYLGTNETIANNSQIVHIEHIMPKQLSNIWDETLDGYDEVPDDYIDRIGNLTLLKNKLNQSASNKSFQEKKDKYYSASEFKITKELLKYSDWNFESIYNRQRELAEIAVHIWKISESQYSFNN
ncbi:DUF262 domain-containing protein [Fictibacillus terranigra]|uniref:DUF262 domain-containing HNH endonuclease family protein n=1 Tax=Fictibacillus terranigra TaxID=3058424 RepID=A0ABT8EAI1_9BACL|nr:DUF262 domain-containing HNH endonuclease family protein [Fictibacillus sp. CENA-BCM004]MDN4074923.1 DUF262 domain-containing HNH endonuclease family protein [Fictibacillus sp. CENA-BCM004]